MRLIAGLSNVINREECTTCIKACPSINNYQLVWLFIRKINRRHALSPLRDQDKESFVLQKPLKKKARVLQCFREPAYGSCLHPFSSCAFLFVSDLGYQLIMFNAPGKSVSSSLMLSKQSDGRRVSQPHN